MRIWESVRIAFSAMIDNKLRSVLTLLGIVIGVGAVISVMSIGKGSSAAIRQQIEGIGTNLVFVRPGAASNQGVHGGIGSAQTLTLDDARAIADANSAPDVSAVAPEVNSFGQARAGRNNVNTRVAGVTAAYGPVRNYNVDDGRFITDQDVQAQSQIAVLGSRVARTLFEDANPIGQFVFVNQRPFRVVGVLKPLGGGGLGVQDDVIVAPITTVQTRLTRQQTARGSSNVQLITAQVADQSKLDAAKAEITDLLRQRHQITDQDDFVLTSQEDIIQARQDVNNVLTIFLGAIAGISLVVGGIGVMNIMLVSVTERTREIGIRKAVGAKRRDIMTQFLAEAVLLSLGGGAIGLGAGIGVSRLLEKLTINNQRVQTIVTADIALLAVGVAAAVGLFFGTYPALRASRLDPIEALRR